MRPLRGAALLAALAVEACAAPPEPRTEAHSGAAPASAPNADPAAAGRSAQSPPDGWQPLFDGQGLSGWVAVNGAADTWHLEDGTLRCSGHPTGVLRSPRQYRDFELELDWRHLQPGGNAGLFVWSDPVPARGQPFTRSIEMQIMDGPDTANYTTHGDLFSIHGALLVPDRPHPAGWERCLPSERRSRPAPEWNHYRLTARDGTLALEVNGAVVSSAHDCTPRQGYLCLEAEGSPVEFRNLRLRELPPGPALPLEQVAAVARGERALWNGTDFQGWCTRDGLDLPPGDPHWSVDDWTLVHDGQGAPLFTRESFGDVELVLDWRPTGAEACRRLPVALRGCAAVELPAPVAPDSWHRAVLTLDGGRASLTVDGDTVLRGQPNPELDTGGPLELLAFGQPIAFANLYVRELP